jgi:hypothetical protein
MPDRFIAIYSAKVIRKRYAPTVKYDTLAIGQCYVAPSPS